MDLRTDGNSQGTSRRIASAVAGGRLIANAGSVHVERVRMAGFSLSHRSEIAIPDYQMQLGTLIEVPLKEIWQGEATHFTPWLAENLSRLGDKIGMELELQQTEADAGDFAADIIASDVATNRRVVIENQFGLSDHKHLGQILTYSSVLNASVVVWVAETIRQEHRTAIDFLNQNLRQGLRIYAVEAKVVRIDDSKPAFRLDIVCAPTDLPTPVQAQDGDTRERYRAYFQTLIDELRTQHKFTNARLGQPQSWYTFSSENSKAFKYSASFARKGKVRAEIYIDCGDKVRNEALFDWLHARSGEIEKDFGAPLEWERLDTKSACRIAVYRDGEIDADTEVLADIRTWMIAQLLKLKSVFPRYVAEALKNMRLDGSSE